MAFCKVILLNVCKCNLCLILRSKTLNHLAGLRGAAELRDGDAEVHPRRRVAGVRARRRAERLLGAGRLGVLVLRPFESSPLVSLRSLARDTFERSVLG